MSYYYSNPGGFSISKTVLPSVTSSICQSAGLNSGGVVRESATVSTTSTAVGPYIKQLGGGSGGGGGSAGGTVISITITNGGSGYITAPILTFTQPPPPGIRATATCTISGGVVNTVTITNPGSGYISDPELRASPPPLGSIRATFQAFISSGSSSSASTSTSFQQVVDNDPKIFLLK